MKQPFVAFVLVWALVLNTVPVRAADLPTEGVPLPEGRSTEPCCALPENHGLVIEAPDAYRLLGLVTDPRNPQQIDPVAVSTRLSVFKRKCRSEAEVRTSEIIEILTERKTHALYDWFLAHLRAHPDNYQGTGLEHVALFDQYFLYLGAKHGGRTSLEPFKLQQELVEFLGGTYRADGRYDASSLKAEVEKTQREAEVTQKAAQAGISRVLGGPWPWILGCSAALAVAGAIALHEVRRDGVAPVEQRLPQVIDRDTIRHPVQPPPEAPAIEKDPAFQHGKEAAEDLFGTPPAPKAPLP